MSVRDATRRWTLTALALAACSGLLAPAAWAELGRRWVRAGSTSQGDILRGEGVAAMGFGQYNLATAMAASINTDTSIRWNQYVYLSIQEDLHNKFLHRMAHLRAERGELP